ncbi:MAG: ABC-2 transporter permease [Anaerolineaceae bacterium]|nr:ABC-2 transporter permease [Anaerolineaceae bacterium]
MGQILAMMRKDFWLWAQKPGSWIIIFVIPLLFIWIMQAVFGSSGTPVVTIYAVNEDESQESERVMQALRQADNLNLDVLATRSDADRLVGAGEHMAAVVIPEGFGSALSTTHGARIDIIIDPARSEQANIVVGLLNAALGPFIIDAEVSRSIEASVGQIIDVADLQPTEVVTPEPTFEETFEVTPEESFEITPSFEETLGFEPTLDLTGEPTSEFSDLMDETPEVTPPANDGNNQDIGQKETLRLFFIAAVKGVVSNQVQENLDNPQVQLVEKPFEESQKTRKPSLLDSLVPGYSLMFMFFLISNLAQTVVEERETGTLRRLLSAPVPRSRILLGKMLPYFLIGVVQMIFILLASKFLFKLDLGGSPIALGVLIIATSLSMAGLGILIAALARTEGQANGLAMIIVLAMAVVSGSMFPSIYIPGLQTITPHYWSMQGFLNVISRGQGIEGIMLPVGILITMAAVSFTIGAIRFRFE